MLNQENKYKVSFEGKGRIEIQGHKYTKELDSKIKQILTKKGIKISGEIKDVLSQNGWLNKKEEVIKILPPKKVVITGGKGFFDEGELQDADFVFQKAGKLEIPIKAKNITLAGGEHVGVQAEQVNVIGRQNKGPISADNLKARNAKISVDTTVKKTADYHDSTNTGKLEANKIKARGNSKISRAAVVYAEIGGNSKFGYSTVEKSITAKDNARVFLSEVKELSKAKGEAVLYRVKSMTVMLHDNAQFLRGEVANWMEMANNSFAKKFSVGQDLNLKGHSRIENGTITKCLFAENFVTMKNITVTSWMGLTAKGHVQIENIKAKKMQLLGKVVVGGKVQGKIEKIDKGVIFKPEAKLDRMARTSLPWYRLGARYLPGHKMAC